MLAHTSDFDRSALLQSYGTVNDLEETTPPKTYTCQQSVVRSSSPFPFYLLLVHSTFTFFAAILSNFFTFLYRLSCILVWRWQSDSNRVSTDNLRSFPHFLRAKSKIDPSLQYDFFLCASKFLMPYILIYCNIHSLPSLSCGMSIVSS
jgi:hypothetical protein